MTWRDKLEIGLKENAPFRRDNLPDFQKSGNDTSSALGEPERSPEEPGARQMADVGAVTATRVRRKRRKNSPA